MIIFIPGTSAARLLWVEWLPIGPLITSVAAATPGSFGSPLSPPLLCQNFPTFITAPSSGPPSFTVYLSSSFFTIVISSPLFLISYCASFTFAKLLAFVPSSTWTCLLLVGCSEKSIEVQKTKTKHTLNNQTYAFGLLDTLDFIWYSWILPLYYANLHLSSWSTKNGVLLEEILKNLWSL